MIRVMVVDDHPVVLAGLTALVEADPSMTVVGAHTGALGAASTDIEPDVCVVDLRLQDGDGIALGLALKQRWPRVRVLILTMSADPAAIIRTLGAGLDGYLLKDADPAELRAAIRSAAEGSVVLGSGASGPVASVASALPDTTPLAALDSRDREILALLVDGLNPSQIGERLFISPKTVRNRTSTMLTKLGVTNRDDAITLGIAAGMRGADGGLG